MDNNLERYLHIGCGGVILPTPFENLDTRPLLGVDHISGASKLDFPDNSFDLVYSSHVLEHFKRAETQAVLDEWVRIVKPGGTLRISVPDFESLIRIYDISGDIGNVIGPLMGGQSYDQNFHYNLFDKNSLTNLLEIAGCEAVTSWDYKRTSHSRFSDYSQSKTWEIPISLNLEARKQL